MHQDWKEGRPVNQIEIVSTTKAAKFNDDDEEYDDLDIRQKASELASTFCLGRISTKKHAKMHKSIMNSYTFSLKMPRIA